MDIPVQIHVGDPSDIRSGQAKHAIRAQNTDALLERRHSLNTCKVLEHMLPEDEVDR